MNKLFLMFLLFAGFVAGSCSDSEEDEPEVKESITLISDKPLLLADNKDEVVFTVKDRMGVDVTGQCVIKVGEEELVDNVFKTTKPGTYKVIAKNSEGVVSNEISVVAVGEDIICNISADKKVVLADGGDLLVLSMADENGMDVTTLGEFFVNGKKLEGNIFRTVVAGQYTVSAKLNGKDVENTLLVAAVSSVNFTGRLYVEEFTGSDCPNCESTIKKMMAFAEAEPRMVLVSLHSRGEMFNSNVDSWTKDFVAEAKELYQYTGTPDVRLNRVGERVYIERMSIAELQGKVPLASDVALSLVSQIAGDQVTVSAKVATKRAFSGKIFAVLVENGRTANQTGLGVIEMRQVMRAYAPSFGGEDKTFVPGNLTDFSVSLPCGVAVPNKCEVVVVVLDENGKAVGVQHVAAGKVVGY